MADVTHRLLKLDQDIRLKIECVVLDHTHKKTHSEIKGNRKLVSEKSALELELDINEIQELQTMCMQPLVRNILASIIVQFETVLDKTHCRQKSNTKEERK
jgi:pullulanase/glycogen debranching enzyme